MVCLCIASICEQARLLRRPVTRIISAAVVLITLTLNPLMLSVPVARAEEAPGTASALVSPAQMAQSLDSAIASHRSELAGLKNELQQLEVFQDKVQSDISAYNAQNTTHGQMLLVSQLRIEDLEYAINSNRLTSRNLAQTIDRFQGQWDATVVRFKMTAERIELARNQIDDIRRAQLSDTQEKQLEAKTRNLIEVLQKKKALGDRIAGLYEKLLDQANQAQAATVAMEAKLLTRLEVSRRASLFSRSDIYRDLGKGRIRETLRFFAGRLAAIFNPTTWKTQWAQVKLGGAARWAVFLAALSFVIVFQGRCRSSIQLMETRCEGAGWYYRGLGLRLLRRALPYLGLTILFSIYNDFDLPLLDIGLTRFLLYLFLVLLITRLGLDYLNFGFHGPPTVLRNFVAGHLERIFRFFRWSGIAGILLTWIAGRDNLLYWLFWDILSLVYIAWAVIFWRQMKTVLAQGVREGQAAPAPQSIVMLRDGAISSWAAPCC